MTPRIDLYTNIHKGQRRRFFNISNQAGTLDYTDPKALDTLYDEIISFREHMRRHANTEEKFIHPILSQRVPSGALRLEQDHKVMHQRFDDIVSQLTAIKSLSPDFERRSELVLEFYRSWSRFTSFYFMHINREEEQAMPTLWKVCTDQELASLFKSILSSQGQEELTGDFKMMLPAMNLQEQVDLLSAGRATIPPEVYQSSLKLAQSVLGPNEWAALKTKLGMP